MHLNSGDAWAALGERIAGHGILRELAWDVFKDWGIHNKIAIQGKGY
jgi:hypothetical protein